MYIFPPAAAAFPNWIYFTSTACVVVVSTITTNLRKEDKKNTEWTTL